MEGNYILKMENIVKEYAGNRVLKGVNLEVAPGEIHALMGENGAGKSTLMNILFGMPVIQSLRSCTGLVFDVHMMVEEPGRYVMTVVTLGGNYQAAPITRSFQITK